MKKNIHLFLILIGIFTLTYAFGVYANINSLNRGNNPPQSQQQEEDDIQEQEEEVGPQNENNAIDIEQNENEYEDEDKPNNKKIEDITENLPEASFLTPQNKKNLKKKINIKLKVKDAENVEFHIRHFGALSSIYLGQGEKKNNNIWHYLWQTKNFPNGKYKMYAKIKNQYGSYESEKIEITISNPITTNKQSEEIVKEIKQKEEKIDTEAEKEKSKHKEKFEKETEEEITKKTESEQEKKEVKEIIQKDVKPEIEKLDKKIKEITQKQKEIEEEKEKEVQRKQEEAKKELKSDKSKKQEKEAIQKQKEIEEEKEKEVQRKQEEITKLVQEKEKIKKDIIEKSEEIAKKTTENKNKEEIKNKIKQKLEDLEKSLTIKEEERQKKIKEIKKQDTDNDKVPDLEEARLGTDVLKADTDEDGYLDSDEILNGYDPLSPSPGDKIIFESPKKKGEIKKEYQVTKIKTKETKKGRGILISGKALPNTFVTIYIYSSQPTVVITKTDENGNWSYLLDKPLEDGEHEVYATVTDNRGKISSKSKPMYFVKQANAITSVAANSVFDEKISAKINDQEKTSKLISYTVLGVSIIIFIIGVALIIIGIRTSKKYKMNV